MKKWLLLFAIFLPALACGQGCSSTTYGHWTCIQQAKGFSNGGNAVASFGSNVGSGGHLIVAAFAGCLGAVNGCELTTGSVSTTDTLNGTFQCPSSSWVWPGTNFDTVGVCYWCGSASGADTVTNNIAGSPGNQNFHSIFISEWSSSDGACTTGGIDAFGTNFNASSSPPFVVATSGASVQSNELAFSIMTVVCCNGGTDPTGVSSPFAVLDIDTHGYSTAAGAAASPATYTASWTNSAASKWTGVTVTFDIAVSVAIKHRSQVIKWKRIPWDRPRRILELEKT